MVSLSKKILFAALLSFSVVVVQTGCKSNSTESSNLASASPTPTVDPNVVPSPTDAAGNAGGVSSGGTSASSGGGSSSGSASSGGSASGLNPSSPVSSAPAPPPAPPRVFTLAAGTPISVWTTSTISTKTAKSGDSFTGTLGQPIVDGDWVVAKKGATVEGVVVDADQGGRVKGVASLTLQVNRLTLADGRTIDLETSKITRQAKSTKKKDAVKVGVGAGIGAAIGAIAGGGKGAAIGAGAGAGAGGGYVLATKGDPAVIGSESQLTFRTTSSVKVTKR